MTKRDLIIFLTTEVGYSEEEFKGKTRQYIFKRYVETNERILAQAIKYVHEKELKSTRKAK